MPHIIASQVVDRESSRIWEGQNPHLDVECATEISALRRYGHILVPSCNMAVMPIPAKGCPRTKAWNCVLRSGLSEPAPHSEDEKNNNKLYFKRAF